MKAYASPDEWLIDAQDWQKSLIEGLIETIVGAAQFEQEIKHGNLFFLHEGQCILIRHEPERVILGFFRGKRLRDYEPLLKASGKYELANMVFAPDGSNIPPSLAELARRAAALNKQLGDPRNRANY